MFKLIRFGLALILVLLSGVAFSDSKPLPKSIHLASTPWCPYICDSSDQRGFIVEYMTNKLSLLGIDLKVDVLPWSRAILLARRGDYDGLLTAVASEAPDFHLTTSPSGTYQVCLYKKAGRNLKYIDRSSFQNLVLGGIKDYGYGEPIDSLISNPMENEKAYLISHSKPLESLIIMTHRNRVDLFAEDSAVIGLFLKNNPTLDFVENAGCIEEVPFFTAISPNHPRKDYWLSILNQSLSSSKSKELYEEAKSRYSN